MASILSSLLTCHGEHFAELFGIAGPSRSQPCREAQSTCAVKAPLDTPAGARDPL
jgi:hypothetical protein